MGKSLRWLGPILDCSGYASAARGYLRACDEAGLSIQARDRSRSLNLKDKGMDGPILELYNRLYKTKVPDDAPAVQHQVPDCLVKDSRSKCPLAYTIFEMTRVPKHWVSYCNQMSAIWTGSEYSKAAFLNTGVKVPVHVLPHALDMETYSPAGERWNVSNRRKFAFLSVFDFTARKAWQDLLRAYWYAFKNGDDVCLMLKVYYGDFSDASRADIVRRIAAYRNELKITDCAPILLYGYDVPAGAMPALYRSADCYVGVSREGFGLAYAEAMACGLCCIGPEVGGTRQYMRPENSLLVKYLGDEPISQEMVASNPSFEGLSWARHSWEDLAAKMRLVVENEGLRKSLAKKGEESVRTELTFKAIGNRINALLPD